VEHPILEALRRDHQNVTRVMTLASKELDALADGREADYSLLEDAFRYLTGYSDLHHHPLEDLVYAELTKVSPQASREIEPIVREHDELIRLGQEFLAAVEAVEESAIIRLDRFVQSGKSYLAKLGEHMGVEERALFPLAAEQLSADSWALIQSGFQRAPDPLFGSSVEREYEQLLARIRA